MEKIEISGFEYIGTELSFRVNEDLYRESNKDGWPVRWTSIRPERYISTMESGTVLMFSGIYREEDRDIIHFIAVSPGSISTIDEIELTIKELEILVNQDLLKFKDVKDVKEITITPAGTLIQDPEGWTFNHPIYLPNDVYIIVGKQEYKDSGGKLGVGQKISLRDILSSYSKGII